MPSTSEDQRRAAGAALSAKRGKKSKSELFGAAKQMASSMTEEQLRHFAAKPVKKAGYDSYMTFLNAFRKVADDETVPEGETPEDVDRELTDDDQNKLDAFMKVTPDVSDGAIHNFANTIEVEPSEAEEHIYTVAQDKLQEDDPDTKEDMIEGGRADAGLTDAPADQYGKGIAVEMEHTDNPEIAREIASDHLDEFPTYYDGLKDMEDSLKANTNMPVEEKEKVAFAIGFVSQCMDMGLCSGDIKIASLVAGNVFDRVGIIFHKVAEIAGAGNTGASTQIPKSMTGAPIPSVEQTPANSFMVSYAGNQIKNRKLAKGGAKPNVHNVFNGAADQVAIRNIVGKA